MRTVFKIAFAALAVTGCSSGDATSTTAASVAPPTSTTTAPPLTTTEPPTTPPPTTTEPPPTTMELPTTAPPTTTAQTPEEIIAERHLAFARVVDGCAMDPASCDPAVSFTEYVAKRSEQYKFYSEGIQRLLEEGQRITNPDRIRREIIVAEIGADGTGHTVNCIANGATYIEADNSTLPDQIGYGREDYFWELIDGKWIATAGILDGISPEGDGQCTF